MEHSPTPWRKGPPGGSEIVAADSDMICHVYGSYNLNIYTPVEINQSAEDRRDLIIRAVNAYADFGAALEEIAHWEELDDPYFDWNDVASEEMAQIARDALAKHKEQTP